VRRPPGRSSALGRRLHCLTHALAGATSRSWLRWCADAAAVLPSLSHLVARQGPKYWGMGEDAKAHDAKLDSSATLADTRSALGARWNVVNWPYVEDNYNMATQGTVPVVAST
jgi:hypothetical protein